MQKIVADFHLLAVSRGILFYSLLKRSGMELTSPEKISAYKAYKIRNIHTTHSSLTLRDFSKSFLLRLLVFVSKIWLFFIFLHRDFFPIRVCKVIAFEHTTMSNVHWGGGALSQPSHTLLMLAAWKADTVNESGDQGFSVLLQVETLLGFIRGRSPSLHSGVLAIIVCSVLLTWHDSDGILFLKKSKLKANFSFFCAKLLPWVLMLQAVKF